LQGLVVKRNLRITYTLFLLVSGGSFSYGEDGGVSYG
jgi:hypothetical protein